MFHELKSIVSYVTGLMSQTDQTWRKLAKEETPEAGTDYMLMHYYWPIFAVSALCRMLLIGSGGLFGEGVSSFDLQLGMKAMVEFVVVYAVSPMLIVMLFTPFYRYLTGLTIDREKLTVFVHYTMSTLIILEVCCAIFPAQKFLYISQLYVIYIIAVGVDRFLKVDGRNIAVATVVFSILFYIAPQAISFSFNIIDRL